MAPEPPKDIDANVLLVPLLAGSVALSTIALPAVSQFRGPYEAANSGWLVAALTFFSVLLFLQSDRSVKLLGLVPLCLLLIFVAGSIQGIRKPSERLEAECSALQANMHPESPNAEAAAAIFVAYRCPSRL